MTIQFVRLGFGIQVLVLIVCSVGVVTGQSKAILLQHIVFKDKILEKDLNEYAGRTGAKVVEITVEKRNNAFLYKLSKIYYFERVKDYPTPSWGKYSNRIVVFDSGPELSQVCTISDTTAFANMLQYIRPLLPNMYTPTIVNGKKVGNNITKIEGLEWTFKVENGKEVWLWSNDGYDSRDISEVPCLN